MVTQKRIQYALRAIFELAKHRGKGPIKTSEIARAQAIPLRFLEVILNQLKGSGLVKAKRGFYGGYYLACGPEEVTVGDIMRYLQGTLSSDHCEACISKSRCPFNQDCAFAPMWNQVHKAMYSVYDGTTLMDLIRNEQDKSR